MFSCGKTKKEADTAAAVFADAMSIAVYSESFGGALPLDEELTRFIKNWEVESYRAKVALSGAAAKRLSEKVSIVTGAAQGFGRGIAEAMLEEGAYVAIADMNYEAQRLLPPRHVKNTARAGLLPSVPMFPTSSLFPI